MHNSVLKKYSPGGNSILSHLPPTNAMQQMYAMDKMWTFPTRYILNNLFKVCLFHIVVMTSTESNNRSTEVLKAHDHLLKIS